jgi:hypothetical protein
MYINGKLVSSQTNSFGYSYGTGSGRLTIGFTDFLSASVGGSLALAKISVTAASAEQIDKMYNDEKVLFTTGAKACLYGSSNTVTALTYDDATDLLHVGTSAGRSVFDGLLRVDNTTTAVSQSISASNGLVVEQ